MLLLAVSPADAQSNPDWPRWRGLSGDGSWEPKPLPKNFATLAPQQLWTMPVGKGFGGVVQAPPAKPLIAAVEGYGGDRHHALRSESLRAKGIEAAREHDAHDLAHAVAAHAVGFERARVHNRLLERTRDDCVDVLGLFRLFGHGTSIKLAGSHVNKFLG